MTHLHAVAVYFLIVGLVLGFFIRVWLNARYRDRQWKKIVADYDRDIGPIRAAAQAASKVKPTSIEIVEDYSTCLLCFMPLDLEDHTAYRLYKGKVVCTDRAGCRERRRILPRERIPAPLEENND